MMKRTLAAVVLVAIVLVGAANAAENVNVTVDGTAMQFRGLGAQVIGGRILVPFRGVLEKMGAFVGWDAASRTVVAQKADRDVALPIGSRTAKVNGANVQLDTPAMILLGTTMVPLRFVGEALGANVVWNGTTRTVQITTAGGATPPVVAPPTPSPTAKTATISSFSHDGSGWLTKGEQIKVALKGTPGAIAVFEISGVTSQIPLREVSAGQYRGTWTVPSTANSVKGAKVIATLAIGGNREQVQAAKLVNVDVTLPVIKNLVPASGSSQTQRRPTISATYHDPSGSGIDPKSVKLTVDRKNVTAQANVSGSSVTYHPVNDLPVGARLVGLVVRDKAGNLIARAWRFTIK